MANDVVIEPVGDGPYVRVFVDGYNVGSIAQKASLVFQSGHVPTLTVEVPFIRCRYNGKCAVHFEDDGNDSPVEMLLEENEQLRKMVDDLNRRIAILLDT